MAREQLRRRDWLAFALAALIPGFGLAIACSGIFQYAFAPMAESKSQVTMWIVPPLWVLAAGLAFGMRTAARAWVGLTGAMVLAAAIVALLRVWGVDAN